ncbi:MAG: PTS sugar transporter subunit IIA [bacterium]|nr:PTS sugar transporter subunit IIA [Planctomycetota bacterium]HIL51306.1 PTS sugar transporter subunit IIA [Planctomycetota bacterium]
MSFWKQFKPKSCSINLKASEKAGAVDEIVENMIKFGVLDEELRETVSEALSKREQLASTGVGMGVAIPHVKIPGLNQVVCTLSIHSEGIEWAAVDGEVVHIFFTILRPEQGVEDHDPDQHIELMTWIARLSRDADFRSFARATKTKTELVNLLREMSAV